MQKHNRQMSFSLYISALAVTDTVTLLIGQFQYCRFRVINPLITNSQQRILLSWCFCRNISDWCYSGTQSEVQYVPKTLKRLKKTLIEDLSFRLQGFFAGSTPEHSSQHILALQHLGCDIIILKLVQYPLSTKYDVWRFLQHHQTSQGCFFQYI